MIRKQQTAKHTQRFNIVESSNFSNKLLNEVNNILNKSERRHNLERNFNKQISVLLWEEALI